MLENLIQSSYSFQTNFILFFGGRGERNFFNIKCNISWGAQNAHTIHEVLLQKAANVYVPCNLQHEQDYVPCV
jgi:hypothetical protein